MYLHKYRPQEAIEGPHTPCVCVPLVRLYLRQRDTVRREHVARLGFKEDDARARGPLVNGAQESHCSGGDCVAVMGMEGRVCVCVCVCVCVFGEN